MSKHLAWASPNRTYTSACWPNLSARASMQTFQGRTGRTVGDECKADGTECVRNFVEPSLNALKRLAQARSGGRAARRDLLTSQPAGPDLWEILDSLSFHVTFFPSCVPSSHHPRSVSVVSGARCSSCWPCLSQQTTRYVMCPHARNRDAKHREN